MISSPVRFTCVPGRKAVVQPAAKNNPDDNKARQLCFIRMRAASLSLKNRSGQAQVHEKVSRQKRKATLAGRLSLSPVELELRSIDYVSAIRRAGGLSAVCRLAQSVTEFV